MDTTAASADNITRITNTTPINLDSVFRGEVAAIPAADWDALIEAASAQRILPSLHSLRLPVPEQIGAFLGAVEAANGERVEAICAEFEAAGTLLNRAGIEPVLLKGLAYIAEGVYPNPGQRFFEDVDILVEPSQLGVAIERLTRNGWVPEEADPFRLFRHHAPPMRRPGKAWIEIHHSVGTGEAARILPARELILKTKPAIYRNVRVRIPRCEDLISHLVIHSQVQHPYPNRIFPAVRALVDLAMLVSRFENSIQWSHVFEQFRRADKLTILILHLMQAQEAVGLSLPFSFNLSWMQKARYQHRKQLRRHPWLRHVDPIYVTNAAFSRRLTTLRIALSHSGGAAVVLRQLFQPANYGRLLTDVFGKTI